MKIIYAGIRSENYDSRRLESFEYANFYLTLKNMSGVETIEYPFDRIIEVGKKRFNSDLLDLAKKEKPDALFAFMYTDELDPRALDRLRGELGVKTIGWFADDYWRFFNYSKNYAPHFDRVITTYEKALSWYGRSGNVNAVLSQWAANPTILPRKYFPDGEERTDVSFIGQYKSSRAKILNKLAEMGIKVETHGFGWPSGKAGLEKVPEIIGRSKINLNLNERGGLMSPRVIGRIFFKRSINKLTPDFHIADNFRAYLHFPTPHIHARPFELAGAGGFVVSGYAEGMEKYYEDGKEMVFYHDFSELATKIKYYLNHPEERIAIRERGYERTIKEHTYEKRFRELFNQMGFGV